MKTNETRKQKRRRKIRRWTRQRKKPDEQWQKASEVRKPEDQLKIATYSPPCLYCTGKTEIRKRKRRLGRQGEGEND